MGLLPNWSLYIQQSAWTLWNGTPDPKQGHFEAAVVALGPCPALHIESFQNVVFVTKTLGKSQGE